MSKSIIELKRRPSIIGAASVVGGQEHEGPLGDCFEIHDAKDDTFGMDTWEKAESEMQRLALNSALSTCKMRDEDIDMLLAGDLLNQCVGSNYGLLSFHIPYLGLYGACSTAAEGLAVGAMMYGGGMIKRCATVSSSHYCSAERQFRFPVEYGGQRSPTSQWTVTGAGAFVLGEGHGPYIADVMPGHIIDRGISDVGNMGAAMAPAAQDTLTRYFKQSKREPESFDLIVTGDLGKEGTEILDDMMAAEGYNVKANHVDCGLLIYDRERQDKHAGGSGCGCSAVVLASHLLKNIRAGVIKDILFVGTGALMSPMSLQQGNSIPGIAHLVHIVRE